MRDDRHTRLLKVTVLDTQTGKIMEDDTHAEWYWTFGNGSCDCNRRMLFGEDLPDCGVCIGAKRYLVVEVDGLDPGVDFNRDYPSELVLKYIPR